MIFLCAAVWAAGALDRSDHVPVAPRTRKSFHPHGNICPRAAVHAPFPVGAGASSGTAGSACAPPSASLSPFPAAARQDVLRIAGAQPGPRDRTGSPSSPAGRRRCTRAAGGAAAPGRLAPHASRMATRRVALQLLRRRAEHPLRQTVRLRKAFKLRPLAQDAQQRRRLRKAAPVGPQPRVQQQPHAAAVWRCIARCSVDCQSLFSMPVSSLSKCEIPAPYAGEMMVVYSVTFGNGCNRFALIRQISTKFDIFSKAKRPLFSRYPPPLFRSVLFYFVLFSFRRRKENQSESHKPAWVGPLRPPSAARTSPAKNILRGFSFRKAPQGKTGNG